MKKAFLLLILLVLLAGYFLMAKKQPVLNKQKINSQTSVVEQLNSNKSFNVLLLGFAGGTHDGAYLTDSIMVAHVDPASKLIALISIPRDIWVNIPTNTSGGSFYKINTSYEIGLDDTDYPNKPDKFKGNNNGGNMTKFVVGNITGLAINNFVAVDFSGFTQFIDDLGGVNVNVERAFDDPQYPVTGKENELCGHNPDELPTLIQEATISAETVFPCRFENLHFDKGVQQMDGATALKFVRSRHSPTDGSDFARSNRQRNLILAVKDKVLSLDFLPKIPLVISNLEKHFATDLNATDITNLITRVSDFGSYTIKSIALTDQNVLQDSVSNDGQAILIPAAGDQNWEPTKNYLAANLDSTISVISPVIQVENGTSIAGLAELASNRLRDKDYNVLASQTAANQKQVTSSITVYNSRIDNKIIKDLESEIGVANVVTKAGNNINYDILIEVGLDYNEKQGKKLIN